MLVSILLAIFVILPEAHYKDDFLSVVFRSINTQGPIPRTFWSNIGRISMSEALAVSGS